MSADSRAAKNAASSSAKDLVQLLVEHAANPKTPAASVKRNGRWEDVTWPQLLEDVQAAAAALVDAGVSQGDRVAIFANSAYEWAVCDLAASAARAITVPIYGSNTADEARYILNHSGSVLVFVDHDDMEGKQVGRLTRLRDALPKLTSVKRIVVWNGATRGTQETTFAEFRAKGAALHQRNPAVFSERAKAIRAEDTCHIIYTSGTTGDPKGVMLSHGNWAYEAAGVLELSLMAATDRVMLFLPLAHSFAQVTKAAWLGAGFQMAFAESTEKLLANLVEVKPTILPSVPRIFEKVFNGVVANGSSAPGVKGKLFRWAFGLFNAYVEARKRGTTYDSVPWRLAKKLVFSKVRATLKEKLGGRMRLFVSGGAPLSDTIAYFFDLLGFQVLEGYGLTETSGGTFVNRPGRIKIGTVGPAFPGTQVKIASDGEILLKGGGVMRGYYNNEQATREAFDAEGFFLTGDIGELDAEGYLRITDRKKDIIVTAGGKNVAPQNIENLLKTQGIVSQAMVYGDKRKYLSVLIAVNEEAARRIAGGDASLPYAALVQRPEVKAAVQAAVDAINAQQPPYASLKKFAIMDHDFSVDSGDLTPSLKVKRKFCTQRYMAILESLYDEKLV